MALTSPTSPFTACDTNDPQLALAPLADALLSPVGSGIAIVDGSISLTSSGTGAVNYYDGSLASLNIGAGLLLTSGMTPTTANTMEWFGQDNSTAGNFDNGDADINAVVNTVFQTTSYDATVLAFRFTVTDPAATSVSIDLVFGSDEYPEWVDQFVDCAVIMVNGVNYAFFNHDPNAPLSVISPNLAAGYFQDNAGNVLPIEYDGVSRKLTIVMPIIAGAENSIKIGIADTGDHILDSGLIVSNMRAGTLPDSGVVADASGQCSEGNDVVTGAATGDLLDLKGGDDVAYAGAGDDIIVAGAGADSVYAGSGNDAVQGDAGDDFIDGGDGDDTAWYRGDSSDYELLWDAASGTYALTQTGAGGGIDEGRDILKGVEFAHFTDGAFALSANGFSAVASPPSGTANAVGHVVVTGLGAVGSTLTAVVSDADGLAGPVSYAWESFDPQAQQWTTIGADQPTYTVADIDAGAQIRVTVTYVDAASHAEQVVSGSKLIYAASGGDLQVTLLQLDAPAGAWVMNPLTTLLNDAVALGLSPHQAMAAVVQAFGLPADLNLLKYDAYATLLANPADSTALQVEQVAVQIAILTSLSDDDTGMGLTLRAIEAAGNGQTIDLANLATIAFLTGLPADSGAVSEIHDRNKSIADAVKDGAGLDGIEKEWQDLLSVQDGIDSTSIADLSVPINQAPTLVAPVTIPAGVVDTPLTLSFADLTQAIADPEAQALAIIDAQVDQGGGLQFNEDGSLTFMPDPGFEGPVELSYTVADSQGASVTVQAMFVIAPVTTTPLDTQAPVVTLADDVVGVAIGDVTYAVDFDEAVTGLSADDFSVSHGTVSSVQPVGDSGMSYTVVVTPDSGFEGDLGLTLLAGAVTDAAGNANAQSSALAQAVDSKAPTVAAIAYGAHDGGLALGESVTFNVTMSEAVSFTGTPTLLMSNGGQATCTGGSGTSTLTFSYTAAAGQDTADLGTSAASALAGSIKDLAGNSVAVSTFDGLNPDGVLAVDTVAPTVAGFSPADGASLVAVGANIVVTFSEMIARGAGTISLRLGSPSGAVVESFDAATSSRIAVSGPTLTLDPSSNLASNTTYFVTFSPGSVRDSAGNAYAGSSTYDFTTVPAGNLINGTAGADTLTGGSGVDIIYGLAGNDILKGAAGVDILDGGDGSDIYLVAASTEHGAAEFYDTGTSGVDEVRFDASNGSTLTLYAGDKGIERIVIGTGTAASAVTTRTTALNVNASALQDAVALTGNAGANVLTGGQCNDTLSGNAGVDTFIAVAGSDTVTDLGNGGADIINVAAGASLHATVTAAWTASGASFNKGDAYLTTNGLAVNLSAITSTAAGNLGFHVTNTGAGTALTGSSLGDWLRGGAGNDILSGGGGADVLDGGSGSDVYMVTSPGEHGAAEFADSGLAGTDEVRFSSTTAGSTLMLYAGDTGIERFVIGTGTSATATTTGTVALNINASALVGGTSLVGNAGANVLTGGSGDDVILGSLGNDVLAGGGGADQLRGGNGNDTLTGGAGADAFIFDLTPNARTNLDTVTDFLSGTDELQFSKAIFKGLSVAPLGDLGVDAFWSGAGVTAAHDASDRFIYNTTSGALYYDADGSGSGAAVQVALLGTAAHPGLLYSDLQVIA